MKQKKSKKQYTEQKNIGKERIVHKPLILYFLIVCMVIVAVALIVSAICYGVVVIQGEAEHIHINRMDDLSKKDVAIVPGTAVYEGSLTAKAKDRLLAAIQLYEEGLVHQIVVSGDVKEATAMTRYLMQKEVPADAILTDEHGIDTYETIARVKEKLGEKSYYFCTQELYAKRSQYLMEQMHVDGTVICVDLMYYNDAGKNRIREYFAATKAVAEIVFYSGKSKKSITDLDFIVVEKLEENPHLVYADELEVPEDYRIVDVNPTDAYDVTAAVEYARTYALEVNPEYPEFEENCTNFVSQCLSAGGIEQFGEGEISDSRRWNISGGKTDWYSISGISDKDGLRHYSTSSNFINTDAFIQYFTKERGYAYTVYNNDYEGRMQCLSEVASGDILILYNPDETVAHVGVISGISENNVFFCANTTDYLDYGMFKISEKKYAQFGILHMSDK